MYLTFQFYIKYILHNESLAFTIFRHSFFLGFRCSINISLFLLESAAEKPANIRFFVFILTVLQHVFVYLFSMLVSLVYLKSQNIKMQTMNILRDAKTFSKICHKDYLRFLYILNMSKKQLRLMFKELFDLFLCFFNFISTIMRILNSERSLIV